jgi:hypothetical protein
MDLEELSPAKDEEDLRADYLGDDQAMDQQVSKS